jgi:hypothetical protein
MIKGYISTYKQLELLTKFEVEKQIELYASGSKHYDKNVLRKSMMVYKAAKALPQMMREFNARCYAKKLSQQTNCR